MELEVGQYIELTEQYFTRQLGGKYKNSNGFRRPDIGFRAWSEAVEQVLSVNTGKVCHF